METYMVEDENLTTEPCRIPDLKDLIPALRDLKATKFLEMAEMTGFVDRLHDENFTVFCPPDNSIENTDDDEMSNVIPQEHYVETRRSKSADTNMKTFTSHLTKGFIRLDDLEDEIVVDTENPEVRIRLNVYNIPYKLVMANCVPVTSYNNYARNGIIHTVEKKLPVATKTVADIIAGDSQFSILKRLLSQAGLVPTLRDPRGNFTVFAPSDISFQVDPRMLDSLIDGTACVDNLLKNHIVDHVICSSALANEAQTANLLGEFLTLSRHLDSKIYVDDVQVVVKDIVGTNGVVHIIDGILNPRQAKRVIQVLEETSINQFLDLLKRSELASYFDQIQNVTFLVPSNVAVRKFPRNEMQRILSDKNKLNDLILNHVIRTEVTVTDMENVPELHTASENGSLRVRTRRAFPFVTKTMTIQCANIISPDNRLCGSILHVVDRVLPPAKRTVVEELESRPEFSMFLELLRLSGLDRRLSEQSETFTVLAPIDEVFLRLPRSFLENLRTDRLRATHFLKTHIISDYFCCDHLAQNIMSGSPQVRSVDGSLLRILSYPAGVLRIGEARIIDCDVAAHNGVLHAVDNIVYNERTLQQNRNIFFDPVWTGV